MFDGKDYFTVYDFVEAHEHFNDEEWDGPPLARHLRQVAKMTNPAKFAVNSRTSATALKSQNRCVMSVIMTLAYVMMAVEKS